MDAIEKRRVTEDAIKILCGFVRVTFGDMLTAPEYIKLTDYEDMIETERFSDDDH